MKDDDRSIHLNRRDSIVCGVCAGIADFFGINAFWIRLGVIVATFTWPLTIAVYFVLYFCLDEKKPGIKATVDNISNSRMGKHFRNVDYSKSFKRNGNRARITGVCAGIADYLEINVFFVRLVFVLSLVFGPFAVIAYIIASFLMDKDGSRPNRSRKGRRRHRNRDFDYHDEDIAEADFAEASDPQREYKSYQRKRYDEATYDVNSVDGKFSKLEEKLQKLEAAITSKKFKIHSEFKRM